VKAVMPTAALVARLASELQEARLRLAARFA
jgi:hypothetical protein